MRKLLSRRVLGNAAAAAALIAWIQLFEPGQVRPTVLIPAVPAAPTELAVQAGDARSIYKIEKERITLVGPPAAVADEQAHRAKMDQEAKGPSMTDLTGTKVPSQWRDFRLSELAIKCMNALAAGGVVRLPEPSPADRALYGVDHPEVVAVLTAGQRFEVVIGAAAPGTAAHYFHCPGAGTWGLISGDVSARLARLARRELSEE